MPRSALRVAALAAGVVGLLLGSEAVAWAYPQWQLATDAVRCNQCHYAPAGGGLLNSYGRDAAGEQLSTFGGNGAFLHGAADLPAWLALGGDFRGAFVANDVQDPGGTTVAVFPMQADLRARVAFGAGFSFAASGGLRGQVRDPSLLVPHQNYQPVSTSEFLSREHYAMWQPETLGPYVRVGRFYAPYGLRFAEHILYVNRDLGFDETQETYNVSGGFVLEKAELHLTLFGPDVVRHIGSQEKGFAGYLETRPNDKVALAGQMRLAIQPGETRFMAGVVAKAYAAPLRTLFLLEVDGVQQVFNDAASTSRQQAVGTIGFSVLPVPSVIITLLGERNQEDLQAPASWTAGTALINWFPYAHVELQLMGRLQFPSGGVAAQTLFFQAHYFL